MIVTIDRFLSNDEATISRIFIDGVEECFGLEDPFQAVKIPHKTRIPAGSYSVTVRDFGGFHARYLEKFGPEFHKGMLWTRNVDNFKYILTHIGNTAKDTDGCLLVGTAYSSNLMTIFNSRVAYVKYYPKVIGAALAGELRYDYLDNDR